MKPVITGMLLLLFGVTVPALAQEEHHEESANQHSMRNRLSLLQSRNKPNLRNRNSKLSLQSRNKPNRRNRNSKLSHRSKSKRRRAKNRTSRNRHATSQGPATARKETTATADQDSAERSSSTNNSKPLAMRNNHKPSTHEMVRKIGTDTNTTKVILVLTIMPALRQVVGANSTDAGSTLTAAIGSMLEHIRGGFTSRTCTSLWERMGYGMRLHTVTLL